jgi:hypothetical protein
MLASWANFDSKAFSRSSKLFMAALSGKMYPSYASRGSADQEGFDVCRALHPAALALRVRIAYSQIRDVGEILPPYTSYRSIYGAQKKGL